MMDKAAIKARLERALLRLEDVQMSAMSAKSLEEQFGNWCVHFTGRLEEQCALTIAYAAVRDPATGRLPCLKDRGCTERCAHAAFPSAAEVAAKVAEVHVAVAAYFTALEQDRCPVCQQPIASKKQEGYCVYAVPCGHRLFQGSVGKESNE